MSLAKLSDQTVADLLDYYFGLTALTPPATFYIALTSGGVELTGNGYARLAMTNNGTNFAATASRVKAMQQIQSFAAATGAWSNVDGWALYNDPTAGTVKLSGDTADLPFLCIGLATGDTLGYTSHGLANGTAVRVEAPTGGTLPAGLSAATTYYVVGTAANTFQLAATAGGAAIDITADGLAWVAVWYGKTGISNTDVIQVPANAMKVRIA